MIFKIRTEAHKGAIISYIQRLPIEKRGFRGRIDPIASQRSNVQNRYAHFVFTMIAEEEGESMDDIKWFYRQLYLKSVKVIMGIEVDYVKSTTELSTIEQEDFMAKVRMQASSERSIFIPLPNEIVYDDEIL